eukprot:GHVU01174630.1.p1 GENE.GHVU01174630.1~~GHVU01174630.1.p1  ORF type:complete len:180 (+),score=15.54 GHVU01174630.1:79-618(+)
MRQIITKLAFVFAAFDVVISGFSKPVFLVEPMDMEMEVGTKVSLRCSATGDPTPTIDWIKASEGVIWYQGANDGRFSVKDDGTFTITSVRKEDAGEYTCEAKNVHGRISAPARIIIVDAHQLAEPLLVPPVGLKASAQSSSTVLLTWYDMTLPGSTDTRYYTCFKESARAELLRLFPVV